MGLNIFTVIFAILFIYAYGLKAANNQSSKLSTVTSNKFNKTNLQPQINTRTNIIKKNSTNKIITLRFGADGTPAERCQCTGFYLCDEQDVVNLTCSTQTCEDQEVCCSRIQNFNPSPTDFPYPSSSNQGSTSTPYQTIEEWSPSTEESSASPPPFNRPSNCTCVSAQNCLISNNSTFFGDTSLFDIRRPNECGTSEICCPPESISSSGGDSNTQQPSEQCGVRNLNIINRIVAPEDRKSTFFGEFPWMTMILTTEINQDGSRTENVFICGASLLSPRIILTAAHCVYKKDVTMLKVRVGEYDTTNTQEAIPYQEKTVSNIRYHPNFNPKTLINDLALLIVNDPFTSAFNVAPICFPLLQTEFAGSVYDPNNCIATGWGKNSYSDPNASFQSILKKVDLSLVSSADCQERLRRTRLGPRFTLHESFICAGGQLGMDTCQGDGGGPLFCALKTNPNRYIQVGVVAWGIGCAHDIPAAYASLESNIDWITTEYNQVSVFNV